ncbi:GGP family predicted mannose transporter [Buttiauxella brennerae ATCC 51605]|uniref:GGP family predicted mannose transporter n=1 Tax=Buttiauxella brennerae ATCC 51605 TaxID=1354251 RepID=A0A1B7IX67_9ENTR|nr:MFS transporter [Buttiauxella brennerae]OAT34646.1 GGP family predicted mannose transporter [Buttiauxella brennerae ATCC 51605]
MTLITALPGESHGIRKPLAVLACAFFLWGCLTSINSVLIPFFYHYFSLTYRDAMLVNVAFYLAPFVACLPCSALMARLGYRMTLILAIGFAVVGCLLMALAMWLVQFSWVLVAIFILAIGVAAMQVVANPYVTRLGPEETAAGRLSVASAINSTGTTAAPLLVAGILVLFPVSLAAHQEPVRWLFLALAALACGLIGLLYCCHLPDFRQGQIQRLNHSAKELFRETHFVMGLLAIFTYVGVEVAIGTTALSYLSDASLGALSMQQATSLIAIYWGGSLAGRMLYGMVAHRVNAVSAFRIATAIAGMLVGLAIVSGSRWGGICLLLVGLMNSLMYPVIFSQSVRNLGDKTSLASAFLIMAGIGGGVLPFLQGWMMDVIGLRLSFLVPCAAYLLLLLVGLKMRQPAAASSQAA